MNTLSRFTFLGLWLLLYACAPETLPNAQEIIDNAIAQHGGERYETATVRFQFRDRTYVRMRNGGAYRFQRIFTDTLGQQITDELRNEGFTRTVGDTLAPLTDDEKARYGASVNSVIYFALLPYRLNDAAVRKKYLGETTLKGQPYHKIEITFAQEGGGDGFQDVYVYWVHTQQFTVDYLAYSFNETTGSGTRFRAAYNARTVGGIRFADYVNYKGQVSTAPADMDALFESGALEELSRIELEQIHVE